MHFDLTKYRSIQDPTERIEKMKQEFREMLPDNQPYLTDLMVSGDTTVMLAMSDLEEESLRSRSPGFLWRIHVMHDEWGNAPKPGDVVERTFPINRKDREGKPVSSELINKSLVDGTYAKRYEDSRRYTVDNKGCIRCAFTDAVYFLSNWGVHGKTRAGLSNHPEHSQDLCRAPNGQEMHVWYWRYAEVDEEDYETLSQRSTSDEHRRGKNK